jgi:RNA polymerase sigma-70 factor (ECF subfamily)
MNQTVALAEFEALFKEHHKSLCDLAYNLVKDKDAAKDIVQDVYFKFWKNQEKIEITDQIKGYLFRATAHTCYNYLRSLKRMIRLDHQSPLMGSLQSKSGVEDIGFRDLELRVQQAIERLPPRCKVIFQLSRQEDMSHKQIAEALNLSVKTIENQMSIALAKLRKELGPFLTPEFFLLLAALAYIATTLFWP